MPPKPFEINALQDLIAMNNPPVSVHSEAQPEQAPASSKSRYTLQYQILDCQMQEQFDTVQLETRSNNQFQPWDDTSRAIWCQWQLEDDRLPRAERLKVLLWQSLGDFAIDIHPDFLGIAA